MFHRRYPAQSLVEFALVAPLVVALILGIIQFGLVFSAYVGLANSAREGSRAAAIYRYTGTAPLTGDTSTVALIDAAREVSLTESIESTLNPLSPSDQITITVVYTPSTAAITNPYRSGDVVEVQLEQEYRIFFGLFGDQAVSLRARSAMTIEPGQGVR